MIDPLPVLVAVDLDEDLGYVWTCWAPINSENTLHYHAESEAKAIRRMLCPDETTGTLVDDVDEYTSLFNAMRKQFKSRAKPGDIYWTRYISPSAYECDCYECENRKQFTVSKVVRDELYYLEDVYLDLIDDLYEANSNLLSVNKTNWFHLHYDDIELFYDDGCSYLPVFDTILLQDSGLNRFISYVEYYYHPMVIAMFLVNHGYSPNKYIKQR